MGIYLVSENIDKHRAAYMAEQGKIVQLMRGIYVDSNENIELTLLKHAIRISKYLYPRAYLSGISAVLLAPTMEGKLYISGPRAQRTRIRNIEIIQNNAPGYPSLASAVIEDPMGEFRIDVSSISQRFLESFRRKSEHSASIDPVQRLAMSERLIEEFGSTEKAADALWILARKNEWYWEGEQAERYFKREITATAVSNDAAIDLLVAWHGQEIGRLSHDGLEWRWKPAEGMHLPLIRQTIPGKLPPFISSLLPEGWLEKVLNNGDERTVLKHGKRYMSNITIAATAEELKELPSDILETKLANYVEDGLFIGTYEGPGREDIESSFESKLAKVFNSSETPRLSGVQIKAPMFLDPDGHLRPSITEPFTHILKPAGTGGFEHLPLIEWLSLELAQQCHFEAPAFALVAMPNGMPPALIVERFDIRRTENDQRQIALEDFCSLLDITSAEKYDKTIEQAARALKAISTSPDADLITLFKRALYAWLIADGDMHLKNLALLKVAEPNAATFKTVTMTPIYDAVTTIVFPGLKHDLLALKMNGKNNRLVLADFNHLAATIGIRASDANAAVKELTDAMQSAIEDLTLPKGINYTESELAIVEQMRNICEIRLLNFITNKR